MRKAIALAVSLFVATVVSGRAEAAQWLMAASGCVPDESDVVAANYQQFGVGVEFKAGFTGDVVLYCPVTPGVGDVDGSGFSLELYALDGDGTSAGANVVGEILKMALSTGTVTSAGAGCTVNSNVDGSGVTTYQGINNPCTHTFDPNNNLYFVRITISRTAAQTVRIYGMSIF